MILRDLFAGGKETLAIFVCMDVCVGNVCLYSSYEEVMSDKTEAQHA